MAVDVAAVVEAGQCAAEGEGDSVTEEIFRSTTRIAHMPTPPSLLHPGVGQTNASSVQVGEIVLAMVNELSRGAHLWARLVDLSACRYWGQVSKRRIVNDCTCKPSRELFYCTLRITDCVKQAAEIAASRLVM